MMYTAACNGVVLFILCSAFNSKLIQHYGTLRTAAEKEDTMEGTTTNTDLSIGNSLDGLQKCTLAAMQGEIDALKEKVKKQGEVGNYNF